MPFDPNSAKKAGKKSKRGPAKKEGPSTKEKMEMLFGDSSYGKYLKSLVNENQ